MYGNEEAEDIDLVEGDDVVEEEVVGVRSCGGGGIRRFDLKVEGVEKFLEVERKLLEEVLVDLK